MKLIGLYLVLVISLFAQSTKVGGAGTTKVGGSGTSKVSAMVAANTFLTSLVAYYKLDEASGNATDATANALTLTLAGTITSTTGIIVNARTTGTDDSNTNNFQSSSASFAFGASNFSVSFWFNTSSGTNVNFPRFISKMTEASGNYGWDVEWNSSTAKINFAVSANGTSKTTAVNSATISNNTWYHVVAVKDGTNITLYVNGVAGTPVAFSSSIFATTANFFLFSHSGGTRSFAGLIDECGVWSRTLTSAEVTDLYNSGAGRAFSYFQ